MEASTTARDVVLRCCAVVRLPHRKRVVRATDDAADEAMKKAIGKAIDGAGPAIEAISSPLRCPFGGRFWHGSGYWRRRFSIG